jgi:hypothetical protein
MDPAALATLREVLGPDVNDARAEQLLQEAGGDVSTAVALHFSGLAPAAPAAAQTPVQQLQGIIGPVGDNLLRSLLQRADQNVELAVNLYFSDQQEAQGGPGELLLCCVGIQGA